MYLEVCALLLSALMKIPLDILIRSKSFFSLLSLSLSLTCTADGRYISGPRHVLVHRHEVDEALGLLRLVHGVAHENLAVSRQSQRKPSDLKIIV